MDILTIERWLLGTLCLGSMALVLFYLVALALRDSKRARQSAAFLGMVESITTDERSGRPMLWVLGSQPPYNDIVPSLSELIWPAMVSMKRDTEPVTRGFMLVASTYYGCWDPKATPNPSFAAGHFPPLEGGEPAALRLLQDGPRRYIRIEATRIPLPDADSWIADGVYFHLEAAGRS